MSGLSDATRLAPHVLHRAAWVIPVSAPPLADGGVLVRDGLIEAVGSYRDLKAQNPAQTETTDHGSVALIPALVNAHTHLELTCLDGQIPLPQKDFPSWLKELFTRRFLITSEAQSQAFLKGRQRLLDEGTILFGDITNGACFNPGSESEESMPVRHLFLELLGFDQEDLESALPPEIRQIFPTDGPKASASSPHASRLTPYASLAVHACYSASGLLIQKAKEWDRQRGLPFSIHVAEHEEETEFLRDGTGYCRELLEFLGKWVPGWIPPKTTPVEYLDRWGVLDEKTLLVHVVHMTETDWEIVARRKSPVCFCPRSNHNLNVGKPAVEKALDRGIVCALGTDSSASNTDLNLFCEAAYVLDHYPGLPPETVLSMMTMGGAKALHQDARFGSIEPGKQAALLAVSLPDGVSASRLIETVIHQGEKGDRPWVSRP